MLNNKRMRKVAVRLFFSCAFISCGLLSGNTAHAFTTSNASTAMTNFVNTYWDSNANYFFRNSDHQAHGADPSDGSFYYQPDNGVYTDFWWEAQLWETVMDAYQRTGSSTYRTMIDNVYNGWIADYPNWQSDMFNDDIGWWALASIRAYTITGETKYETQAKAMFDFIYQSYDSTFGGGIWWNRKSFLSQKNVATNGVAAIVAIDLYKALGDSSYLTKGENLYNWVNSHLFTGSSNGKVDDNVHYANYASSGTIVTETWEYSYNQGIFMYASYLMYAETRTSSYLTNAQAAAKWYVTKMSYDGTMNYEGEGDDPAFKMIFCRFLSEYEAASGDTTYVSFLQNNATQAWNHERQADGINGSDWTETPNSSVITSIAAAAGADILQLSSPDNYTGVVVGQGVFEAEDAHENGVSNDNIDTGYSGRGYTAGWNTNGTSIDFPVNELSAGTYMLTFRHSAAAGTASRQLSVNGSVVVPNLAFASTSDWNTWLSSTQSYVSLHSGTNIINLAY